MADYISRDDFAKHLDDIQHGEAPTGRTGENIDYQKGVCAGFDMAYIALKRFPAADVRPVVLCKDCRHRDPEDNKCDCGQLERAGCVFPVDDNYWCAHGEKGETNAKD